MVRRLTSYLVGNVVPCSLVSLIPLYYKAFALAIAREAQGNNSMAEKDSARVCPSYITHGEVNEPQFKPETLLGNGSVLVQVNPLYIVEGSLDQSTR